MDDETRASLREAAVGLGTTDPDPSALAPFGETLAQNRVIGLGVGDGGSRELRELRGRLLRHLITDHGLGLVGLTADFGEVAALDQYVAGGDGEPGALLGQCGDRQWHAESTRQLLDWLREENDSRPDEDRVRLYGLAPDRTGGALDRLTEYLDRVDPGFLETVRHNMATLDDTGDRATGEPAPGTAGTWSDVDARLEEGETLVPALLDRLDERRERYVSAAGRDAWERARQHVLVIEQALSVQRPFRDHEAGRIDWATAQQRAFRLQGLAMADNADWVLGFEDAGSMAVLARDAHLARVESTLRDSGLAVDMLGPQLDARYGDEYYALGTSVGNGRVRSVADPSGPVRSIDAPPADTLLATLGSLETPAVVLDFDTAMESGLPADSLDRPVPARATRHRELTLGDGSGYIDAFDGLGFVTESTPTRSLSGGEADPDPGW